MPSSRPREIVGSVLVEARRVAVILPRHRPEQQSGVPDAPRERPHRVQRRRERDQAVAGDQSVRRLQPHHAAERSRLADRAAGVGAERPDDLPGGDRGGAAAAGAAGHRDPGPTGCGRVRTPSSRWRTPSRTRRSSSCPSARCRGPRGVPRACTRTAGCSPRGSSIRRSFGSPSWPGRPSVRAGSPRPDAAAHRSPCACPAPRRAPTRPRACA